MDTYKENKIVANWLLVGVGMLVVQVLLGGITRLTGSGLSITEWDPLMGALPPLNETKWQQAFSGYQKIAQYKFLNHDFTLSDFKSIFFWEWFHRFWAILLGVVFITGFVYFLARKKFKQELIIPMIILFLLVSMQGLIGLILLTGGMAHEKLFVGQV